MQQVTGKSKPTIGISKQLGLLTCYSLRNFFSWPAASENNIKILEIFFFHLMTRSGLFISLQTFWLTLMIQDYIFFHLQFSKTIITIFAVFMDHSTSHIQEKEDKIRGNKVNLTCFLFFFS